MSPVLDDVKTRFRDAFVIVDLRSGQNAILDGAQALADTKFCKVHEAQLESYIGGYCRSCRMANTIDGAD